MSSGGLVTVLLQPTACIPKLTMLQTQTLRAAARTLLRVLKSLHEIFRACFSHPRVNTAKAAHLRGENSQQKHSRETCLLKTLPTTKKLFPTSHNCLWTAKTGSSAAGTFSYSRKTRSYRLPTTPTASAQLPNSSKATSATKLHYSVPTNNKNSRTPQKQTSGQKHALHTNCQYN